MHTPVTVWWVIFVVHLEVIKIFSLVKMPTVVLCGSMMMDVATNMAARPMLPSVTKQ